ncbi:MAG: sialate O-acetylesterase [Spirochaetia bacterium]|nr:sialate O-acetylesterase [Spirochaetia bacterium]
MSPRHIIFLSLVLMVPLWSEVKLPKVFTDHMVIQRDKEVVIWGTADVEQEVAVTFRGEKVTAVVKNGKWKAVLKAMPAGGPFELSVEGKNQILFKDVLVGEVWLAGGQSNMQFLLMNSTGGKEEIESARSDQIRYYLVAYNPVEGAEVVQNPWQPVDSKSCAKFSAVAHYFAKSIHADLKVPVGIIGCYKGGTPAEAWMNEAFLAGKDFESIRTNYAVVLERYNPADYEKFLAATAAHKEALSRGEKSTIKVKEPLGPHSPFRPSGLYKTMLTQVIPFTIRGFLWYQGEANAARPEQYRKLFPALITNWRSEWNDEALPFLFVQLPSYGATAYRNAEWAWLRDAQLAAAKSVPNTGMVIARDTGEEATIHPLDKKPVGERLAILARGLVYGEKIEYSGPIFENAEKEKNQFRLRFSHTGEGLKISGNEPLSGFLICGEDKNWLPAEAKLENGSIVVWNEKVADPAAVRYAWANWSTGNLFNTAGLPASPFRTDHFEFSPAVKSRVNENE